MVAEALIMSSPTPCKTQKSSSSCVAKSFEDNEDASHNLWNAFIDPFVMPPHQLYSSVQTGIPALPSCLALLSAKQVAELQRVGTAQSQAHKQGDQACKIFVGGIPQRIDQKALCEMFGKVAKLKKAWLQMLRDGQDMRKHRGFGFVVFSAKDAVDQLLGEDFSRFITFEGNLKLEVKRAVGQEQQHGAKHPQAPAHSLEASDAWCSMAVQPRHLECSMLPPFSDLLLEGFVGQMPRNRQELADVLRAATPDHYDD
jgi:hypothetical protein